MVHECKKNTLKRRPNSQIANNQDYVRCGLTLTGRLRLHQFFRSFRRAVDKHDDAALDGQHRSVPLLGEADKLLLLEGDSARVRDLERGRFCRRVIEVTTVLAQ